MNLEPDRIFDPIRKGTVAVIDEQYKFVRYLQSGKEQLYAYRTDSSESQNLLESEPEIAGRMRQVLLGKLSEVNHRPNGRE